MVGPWASEIASRIPYVDRVLYCSFPWFSREPKGWLAAPYLQLIDEARNLKQVGYDCFINLRFDFWWGAMLGYFAGIPIRHGYDTPECRPFLNNLQQHRPGLHQAELNMNLVKAVVKAHQELSKDLRLEFPITLEEQVFAQQWLASRAARRPLIALHPGAGSPVKLWPAQKYAALGDLLADRYGGSIIVTGAEWEEPLVRSIAGQMATEPLTLTGVRLGPLAAVLRACDLVVGADSGILHLAVALGVPTIHLYGPVSSDSFGPLGNPEMHQVVHTSLPCAPCNRLDFAPQELSAHPCIKTIDVDSVFSRSKSLLEEARLAARN